MMHEKAQKRQSINIRDEWTARIYGNNLSMKNLQGNRLQKNEVLERKILIFIGNFNL